MPSFPLGIYYSRLDSSSYLIHTIFKNRSFDESKILEFLNIHTQDYAAPSLIYDVPKATEIINKFIKERKKIAIHGDYDVDGISATAILWDYLYRHKKADVIPIIPNRLTDGYGLSDKTILKAINEGCELIITVDCGIKDIELVSKYKDKISFIITDHHNFRYDENGNFLLPDALCIVHPGHPKGNYPDIISGAATVWNLVRYMSNDHSEIIDYYSDLLTISTICDVLHLTGENRKIVKKNIDKLHRTNRIGLKKLINYLSLDKVTTYDIGFKIGPRINASGRVIGDPYLPLRFLLTNSSKKADFYIGELNRLNSKRQELTEEILEEADSRVDCSEKFILVCGKNWSEGIVGLIASRLSEKYGKPTFVYTINEENKIVGSARSKSDMIYLTDVLFETRQHLLRFGGHKFAAGFASDKDKINGWNESLVCFFDKYSEEELTKKVTLDAVIDNFSMINVDDVKNIDLFEPFGMGNEKPLFLSQDLKVESIQRFGKNQEYISYIFTDRHKNTIRGVSFDGVVLNDSDNVVFELMEDQWSPNGYSLKIVDVLR